MNRHAVVSCCFAAVFAAAVPVFAASDGDSAVIRPATPEAARVISRLEQARHNDRMNSNSYRDGADSDAGIFYYQKGQEIDALLKNLNEGQAVSVNAVRRALDNSDAVRYGGQF